MLTEQTQADPAAELDIAPLETAKKEKQALLSAVASYIAKRVELRLYHLRDKDLAGGPYIVDDGHPLGVVNEYGEIDANQTF